MKLKNIGLYIHIPFCIKKCLYCDFLSYPAGTEEKSRYVEALCSEIQLRSKDFGQYTVSSVFIGGGTPSCLPGESIARILETVKSCFSLEKRAEVTIEMNPGTVDLRKLEMYRLAGVNRLSIGLQSSDNGLLRMLGRIHTYEDFLECYKMAEQAGFDNINVDLISALPGQTKEGFLDMLQCVAELSPAHLSCYGLILEEGTPLFDRRDELELPDEDADREMYHMTKNVLEQYGYRRYEISNYAKPGMESKHNIGYWKRTDYLGIGLGASSFLENCRFKNPMEPDVYEKMVSSGKFDAFREEVCLLSKEESMEEYMFLGLRMMEGIDQKEFETQFGVPFEQIYGETTRRLAENGLLGMEGDRIFLTERGIDISNYVFAEFLF